MPQYLCWVATQGRNQTGALLAPSLFVSSLHDLGFGKSGDMYSLERVFHLVMYVGGDLADKDYVLDTCF